MTSFERVSRVIPEIYKDLEKVKGDYCIIGSAAMVLAGIDISVDDLDILTSRRGAIILKKTWANRLVHSYRPQTPERFRSEFGRFEFSMPVEVMGDLEVNKNGSWNPVEVKNCNVIVVDGGEISVPALEEQKRIYLLLGREKDHEKAKLIFRRIGEEK